MQALNWAILGQIQMLLVGGSQWLDVWVLGAGDILAAVLIIIIAAIILPLFVRQIGAIQDGTCMVAYIRSSDTTPRVRFFLLFHSEHRDSVALGVDGNVTEAFGFREGERLLGCRAVQRCLVQFFVEGRALKVFNLLPFDSSDRFVLRFGIAHFFDHDYRWELRSIILRLLLQGCR